MFDFPDGPEAVPPPPPPPPPGPGVGVGVLPPATTVTLVVAEAVLFSLEVAFIAIDWLPVGASEAIEIDEITLVLLELGPKLPNVTVNESGVDQPVGRPHTNVTPVAVPFVP